MNAHINALRFAEGCFHIEPGQHEQGETSAGCRDGTGSDQPPKHVVFILHDRQRGQQRHGANAQRCGELADPSLIGQERRKQHKMEKRHEHAQRANDRQHNGGHTFEAHVKFFPSVVEKHQCDDPHAEDADPAPVAQAAMLGVRLFAGPCDDWRTDTRKADGAEDARVAHSPRGDPPALILPVIVAGPGGDQCEDEGDDDGDQAGLSGDAREGRGEVREEDHRRGAPRHDDQTGDAQTFFNAVQAHHPRHLPDQRHHHDELNHDQHHAQQHRALRGFLIRARSEGKHEQGAERRPESAAHHLPQRVTAGHHRDHPRQRGKRQTEEQHLENDFAVVVHVVARKRQGTKVLMLNAES